MEKTDDNSHHNNEDIDEPPIPVHEDNEEALEPNNDNPNKTAEAKHPMMDRFIAMFPFTPRKYIKQRLAKIKNNPVALARFTDELLKNPIPKGDWQDDEDDEDDEQVNEWKQLKLTELKSLFPDRCPDWLMENLTNIATMARYEAGRDIIENLENLYNWKKSSLFQKQSLPSFQVSRTGGQGISCRRS